MVLVNHRGLVYRWLVIGLLSSSILGCAAKQQNNTDPLEPLNRGMYKFNRTVDSMYIKPTAHVYKKVVPPPIRSVVGNFLHNLGEIPTMANQLLQGEVKNAGHDFLRFVTNSTLGIFGLFDVATPMGLTRHDEDFGKTLAKWGYKDSSYLMLPILGPSTVRDGIGFAGNTLMNVPYYVKPKWRNRYLALNTAHKRSELTDAEELIDVAGVDEYSFVRDSYLQRRNYSMLDDTANNDPKPLEEPPE